MRGIPSLINDIRKKVFSVWFKVIVACVPGAIVTLLFDDFIEAHLHTPFVIAAATGADKAALRALCEEKNLLVTKG